MKKTSILFIIIMMVLGLTACGTTESPETAVKNGLTAVKKNDIETIQKYFNEDIVFDGVDDELASQEIQALFENMDFEILSSEGETVKTSITNIDMLPVMVKTFEKAVELAFSGISEEEIAEQSEKIVQDILNEDDLEKVTNTVDIKLEEIEGQWKIILNDELMNAMFGNFQAILDDLNNAYD